MMPRIVRTLFCPRVLGRLLMVVMSVTLIAGVVSPSADATGRHAGCAKSPKQLKGGEGKPVKPPSPAKTTVVAHGGSIASGIDYDTQRSLANAWRHCANVAETDFRLSLDRGWLKIHDNDASIATDCPRGFRVSRHTLARDKLCTTPGGSHLASLKQDAALHGRYGCSGIGTQPETKNVHPHRADRVRFHAALKHQHLLKCTVATTGERRTIQLDYQVDPKMQTGWITRSNTVPSLRVLRKRGWQKRIDWLMLPWQVLTKSYVAKVHHLGYRVSARLINTRRAFNIVTKRYHVDQVVTDRLRVCLKARHAAALAASSARLAARRTTAAGAISRTQTAPPRTMSSTPSAVPSPLVSPSPSSVPSPTQVATPSMASVPTPTLAPTGTQ